MLHDLHDGCQWWLGGVTSSFIIFNKRLLSRCNSEYNDIIRFFRKKKPNNKKTKNMQVMISAAMVLWCHLLLLPRQHSNVLPVQGPDPWSFKTNWWVCSVVGATGLTSASLIISLLLPQEQEMIGHISDMHSSSRRKTGTKGQFALLLFQTIIHINI